MSQTEHQARTIARDLHRRMTEGVERWARATGRRYGGHMPSDTPIGWHVADTLGSAAVWRRYGREVTDVSDTWRPEPATLLLWALLVESGLTVDVGRCPACVKRGGPMEWAQWHGSWEQVEAWRRYQAGRWDELAVRWDELAVRFKADHLAEMLMPMPCVMVGARPCPDCNGTGRDTREAARLVLDAGTRDLGSDAHVYATEDEALADAVALARLKQRWFGRYRAWQTSGGWRLHETNPGDQASRDHLSVLADQLQAEGYAGPSCEACGGLGAQALNRNGVLTSVTVVCNACHGSKVRMHAPVGEWLAQWLAGRGEWVEAGVAALDRATDRVVRTPPDRVAPGERYIGHLGVSVDGALHEFDVAGLTAREAVPLLNEQAHRDGLPVAFMLDGGSIVTAVDPGHVVSIGPTFAPAAGERSQPASPPIGRHLGRRLGRRR